jgi:type II secretory pathway pseudopilin PulG
MQDLESNKKNNFPLWGKLLVGFGVIGVLVAINLPSFFKQSNKARSAKAKMDVGSVINLQIDKYKKTGRFAQSWDELGMETYSDKDSYEFQVFLRGGNPIVTATPKKDDLRSLTGFVFVRRDGDSYLAGICGTLEPSRKPPQVDTASNSADSVVCPVGSQFLE